MIPSTKAPELDRELFVAELLATLAERVAALERGRADYRESTGALAEAVMVLQNQASRKAPAKPKTAK